VSRPTASELAILRVLWELGPSTVRAVHDALEHDKPSAYTTTLKLMQIMAAKGFVERDEQQRAHVYRVAQPRESVESEMVGDLLDRLFAGSAAQLVQRALSVKKASREDLREIRRMIGRFERQKGK
jgi:predicted transcriptional regulator